MRHFANANERTPEYVHAVDASQHLMEAAGGNLALRAFAEVVSEQRAEQWAKDAGLRRSSSPCIQRLQGGRCQGLHRCHPPETDHPSLWLKDRKPKLRSIEAYDLAYKHLYHLLPDCVGCGPFC